MLHYLHKIHWVSSSSNLLLSPKDLPVHAIHIPQHPSWKNVSILKRSETPTTSTARSTVPTSAITKTTPTCRALTEPTDLARLNHFSDSLSHPISLCYSAQSFLFDRMLSQCSVIFHWYNDQSFLTTTILSYSSCYSAQSFHIYYNAQSFSNANVLSHSLCYSAQLFSTTKID
jgi:hypothetical protein